VALPHKLTRRLRAVAEGDPDVRALYVFGSRIDGTARPDSDLDVGVLYT
jgi:predicted nucleotidyltransferase